MYTNLPSSWDEWVPESRLLKLNEAGFAKRRALLDAQAKKGRSTGGSGGSGSPGAGKGGLKDKKKDTKKRGRDAMESVRQLIAVLQVTNKKEKLSGIRLYEASRGKNCHPRCAEAGARG